MTNSKQNFNTLHFFSSRFQAPSDLMSSDMYKLKDRPPRCPSAGGRSESSSHYASISPAVGFGGGGVGGMKPSQRSGLNSSSEISSACATPPQNRRRLFSPKNLRSPFGYRRGNSAADNSTTLSGKFREGFGFQIE